MELEFNKEQIIFIGDVHGEFRTLNYELHKRKQIENSLFIQLGDFGIGFHKDNYYHVELKRLNEQLKKFNNSLVVIRGNHDKPSWFDDNYFLSNLFLAEDYSIVNNILLIGGAASTDKIHRLENIDWWSDELPVYDLDKLRYFEIKHIEYVVAHSNPYFIYPGPKFNAEIEDYVSKERRILEHIFQYLSNFHYIHKWFNGHFHYHEEKMVSDTTFISLSIMETYPLHKIYE